MSIKHIEEGCTDRYNALKSNALQAAIKDIFDRAIETKKCIKNQYVDDIKIYSYTETHEDVHVRFLVANLKVIVTYGNESDKKMASIVTDTKLNELLIVYGMSDANRKKTLTTHTIQWKR